LRGLPSSHQFLIHQGFERFAGHSGDHERCPA
jgi:hypothetical protein